ncbi:MAG: hypothetical protein J6B31_02125 [Bacteroidaceae bacterium]|nr:hypothetical protein [Bacteroidaceae bacterium]
MIPFDLLDVAGDGDVIDGINDGVDMPEVTNDIDSPETETPENPENETPENPEPKTDQDSGTESADIPKTEAGQNVQKTEPEDQDIIIGPYNSGKRGANIPFIGKGSCNICRDDGFSCKGGYDGEYKIGAKCKNCGHLYEQHQW